MTDEDGQKIKDEIKRDLRRLLWATIGLYLVIIALIAFLYFNIKNTNDALCQFKDDLQSRIVQTQNYLATHPEGIAGIPAKQLEVSISNQQKTVQSLSHLHCPPVAG